ncbi:MAG: hypothetical protein V7693_15740 [Halopseudomonas sabulinigri]
MLIVTRTRQHVRSLSADEKSLVHGFCDQSLSGRDTERANRLLRQIRQEDSWLVCDCVAPAPVMHVALLDSGRLVLRNNPGNDAHAPGCICGKSVQSGNRTVQYASTHSTVRFDSSDQIALHVEFSSTETLQTPQISRSSANAKTGPKKPILSLLLTLCDDARLNDYNPAHKLSVSEQFARIRQVSERYSLAQGIPLSNAMDTKIDMPRMIQLGKRLAGYEKAATRPMGLLFDRVNGAKSRKLSLLDGKSMGFFGHVERYGPISEPMLAMATVTNQQPGSKFFELGHVALIPSVSDRLLFPVGSKVERELVAQLIGLLDWLQGKGVTVTLHRHLFAGDDQPKLQLKGRGRVLSILLREGGVSDPHPSPPSPDLLTVVSAEEFTSIKRKVAGIFMSDTHAKGADK